MCGNIAEIQKELRSLLTDEQRKDILDKFGRNRLPLYLKLAFEDLNFYSREVKVLGVYPSHPYRLQHQDDSDE